MNIWKYLDIEPTTDIAQIQSAYASQAKKYHPEEYPAEFKILQNAYKTALQYAKHKKTAAAAPPQRRPRPETVEAKQETAVVVKKTPARVQEAEQTHTDVSAARVSYDFSEIDTYGDREQFFRQFHLLVYNPYLINNVTAWQIFLDVPAFAELFQNNDFRAAFIKEVCRLYGFSRETLLYFDRFLIRFQKAKQQPENGAWETDDPVFRRRKHRHIRLSFLSGSGFRNKEGNAFHETIIASFSRQGRTIDLNRRKDVGDYLRSYLLFAAANEEKLERFYWKRKYSDLKLLASCCAVTIAALVLIFLDEWQKDRAYKEQQELFREEILTQQEAAYRNQYVKQKAEEDMDRLLQQYREWEQGNGE